MAKSGTTIDTLEVKISANAQSATASLKSLADALTKVKTALTGVNKDGLTVSDRLSQNLNQMNGALNSITTGGIKRLQKLANSLNDYADAIKKIRSVGDVSSNIKNIGKALGGGISDVASDVNVDKFTNTVSELQSLQVMDIIAESTGDSEDLKVKLSLLGKIGQAFDTLRSKFRKFDVASDVNVGNFIDDGSAGKKIDDLKDKFGKFFDKIKKSNGALSRFWGSIKRIAMYRAIRSALKAISEAFSEGLKNAYAYSKQNENFTRLADTLDRMKSITSQMKNQLGALAGEIIQYIMPAVEWIVDKVRYAAERLTEFMAAMNGEHQYLYARYLEESWDDATEAVKKYKHQLLGLDELNNLSKDQMGKLEGSKDEENKYYRKAVNENVFDTANKIKDIINTIKSFTFKISDILFDWDDINGEDVAQKIITGIGGILGAVVGFKFGGVPGAIVGLIAGVVLTAGIASLLFENQSDETEFTIGDKLKAVLTGIAGGLIGWTIGSKVGGIKGGVAGAVLGATVGFGLSLIISSFSPISNESGMGGLDVLELVKGALEGITSGIISWKIGAFAASKAGALAGVGLGGSVFIALSLLFGQILKANATGMSKERFIQTIIIDLLGAAAGGIIGFILGGPYGAAIGATVGLDLTIVIQDIGVDILDKAADALANGIANIYSFFGDSSVKSYVDYVQQESKRTESGARGAISSQLYGRANGGIVSQGSLFYAGESGAEFVGNIGSTSAVANTGQMTDAIYKAAYMGMSKALKENGGGGMNGFEPATTDDLFIAMRKKANNYNKMTGSSAFA